MRIKIDPPSPKEQHKTRLAQMTAALATAAGRYQPSSDDVRPYVDRLGEWARGIVEEAGALVDALEERIDTEAEVERQDLEARKAKHALVAVGGGKIP